MLAFLLHFALDRNLLHNFQVIPFFVPKWVFPLQTLKAFPRELSPFCSECWDFLSVSESFYGFLPQVSLSQFTSPKLSAADCNCMRSIQKTTKTILHMFILVSCYTLYDCTYLFIRYLFVLHLHVSYRVQWHKIISTSLRQKKVGTQD